MSSSNIITRRGLLAIGAGSITSLLSESVFARITPAQTEGPFYPIRPQADKDVDLTQIKGRGKKADGKTIKVKGRVLNQQGQVLSSALVEIWQANKWGRYNHERDPNRAPLDPNFQGWGQQTTRPDGLYAFTTIFPGAYPAGRGWTRPPHIHFKVACAGYRKLTTQMYFPGEELNNKDLILNDLSSEQQKSLISVEQDKGIFLFDIVLRKE